MVFGWFRRDRIERRAADAPAGCEPLRPHRLVKTEPCHGRNVGAGYAADSVNCGRMVYDRKEVEVGSPARLTAMLRRPFETDLVRI